MEIATRTMALRSLPVNALPPAKGARSPGKEKGAQNGKTENRNRLMQLEAKLAGESYGGGGVGLRMGAAR